MANKQFLTRVLTGVLLVLSWPALAVYQENVPMTLSQPDGSTLHAYVTGDEFFNYLHDARGFTIVQGDDGFYYYADRSGEQIVATLHRADAADPVKAGLSPRVVISEQEYRKRRDEFMQFIDGTSKAPHTGTMINLVVYIRFADDTEFTTPRSSFDNDFNYEEGPSLRHYFQEVSYGQLDIVSHHFPEAPMNVNLSYVDGHPRGYYQPMSASNPMGYDPSIPTGNSTNTNGRTYREHTLLVNAITAISGQIPADMVIDADGDGLVDNVAFIIRGQQDGWAELLWAHRWVLWSQAVFIHGKRVYDYTFQPETQSSTYILCHEMFHTLGAPDLYRYSQDGFNPVGPWDLMHSGFVHMGAYMKYRYANGQWISEIPVISEPGTYTLAPLTSDQANAFRINSPNGSGEYFVVEYRKRTGHYEFNIPGEGLLIYRINPQVNGNAQGPPDEVYLFRPGGTLTDNGNINQAHMGIHVGRTDFNDSSNPGGFLMDGSFAGIEIANITAAGDSVSFDLFPEPSGLQAPENMTASLTENFHVSLSWDPPAVESSDEAPMLAGYLVFRNHSQIAEILDPSQTSLVDDNTVAGMRTYFTRALYTEPDGVSGNSNIVGLTMPGFFHFPEGKVLSVGREAGSTAIDMESNIASWNTHSNFGWLSASPSSGQYDTRVNIHYQENTTGAPRTGFLYFLQSGTSFAEGIRVNQDINTSLGEISEGSLRLYPNPIRSGESLIVSLPAGWAAASDNVQASLYSMSGQRIYSLVPVSSADNANGLQLSMPALKSGIYLLELRNSRQQRLLERLMIRE